MLCRGNSLSSVVGWGDNISIDTVKASFAIRNSVGLFLSKLRDRGLLYVDTISQKEIDAKGRLIELNFPESRISLKGKITHDWDTRIRKVSASGTVLSENFAVTTNSYLISPDELVRIMEEFHPRKVWKVKLETEVNYDVVCARR